VDDRTEDVVEVEGRSVVDEPPDLRQVGYRTVPSMLVPPSSSTSLVDQLHRASALGGVGAMQAVLEDAVCDFLTELAEDPFGERERCGAGSASRNGNAPR
jgi:hypothetical protein